MYSQHVECKKQNNIPENNEQVTVHKNKIKNKKNILG